MQLKRSYLSSSFIVFVFHQLHPHLFSSTVAPLHAYADDSTIVYEKNKYKDALQLQEFLLCEITSIDDDFDYRDYEMVILLFAASKGRCSIKVEEFILQLYNKKLCLLCESKTGFDVNRMLGVYARKNGCTLVYSKYYNNNIAHTVAQQIIDKYICMDGHSVSEMFIGKFFRLFGGSYGDKN